MQKLLIATNNRHKLIELNHILQPYCHICSLKEADIESNPEENGTTLEENALIKARDAYRLFGGATIADDTGLEVEQLGGAPGVHSARYAGEQHCDADNRQKLIEALTALPAPHKARFRTVMAYITPQGEELLFEGIVTGEILLQERGNMGFGYDSLFVPEGYSLTFAEMSEAQKNRISHRAKAAEALASYLKNNAL